MGDPIRGGLAPIHGPEVHDQGGIAPQNQVGQHGLDQVRAGDAPGRGASALKTAWMEVKHFFTSLFGTRVSTPKPDQVTNGNEAAQSVIHQMTRHSTSPIMILAALARVLEHGDFDQDAGRFGLSDQAGELFEHELQGLSDMQLFRLYNNFQKHPELLDALTQSGTAAVMDNDEPTVQQMRGGGKVNDLGFIASALCSTAKQMLEERGYKVDSVDVHNVEPTRMMELFAAKAVANGGDLIGALYDTHQQIQNERQGQRLNAINEIGVVQFRGVQQGEVGVGEDVQVDVEVDHDGPPPTGVQHARNVALQDSNIGLIFAKGSTNMEVFVGFMKDNFEVMSSPEFWSHPKARQNVDNFGAPLALASLELLAGKQGGDITDDDLQNLSRVLNPHDGLGSGPHVDVPGTIGGPFTDDKLGDACDLVYARYFGDGAPYKINMEGWSHEEEVRRVFTEGGATGIEKLNALKEALIATGAGQYMPLDNLTDPLKAIV